VFRNDRRLVVVPVGASFQGWKVVAVEHGGVKVKADGHTVRLAVGGVSTSPAIRDDRGPASSKLSTSRSEFAQGETPNDQQVANPFLEARTSGQTVQVASESNSITRDLGTEAGTVPASGTTPNPGTTDTNDQVPPVETPSTLPPAGEKNVPNPPADPPTNTEKVIPQPKDRIKEPTGRP
jgi:hypothetical protein